MPEHTFFFALRDLTAYPAYWRAHLGLPVCLLTALPGTVVLFGASFLLFCAYPKSRKVFDICVGIINLMFFCMGTFTTLFFCTLLENPYAQVLPLLGMLCSTSLDPRLPWRIRSACFTGMLTALLATLPGPSGVPGLVAAATCAVMLALVGLMTCFPEPPDTPTTSSAAA